MGRSARVLVLKLVKSALVAAVLVSAGAPSISQDDALKAEITTIFSAMVEREGSREAVETLHRDAEPSIVGHILAQFLQPDISHCI